jgi:hypothetical protein
MLNTYIKNRGTTKTIIRDKNHNHINELNWGADYDGDVANISLDTTSNGKTEHFDIKLDNDDLANLLNIPSVNMPINQRLKMDFDNPNNSLEPYYIELSTPEFKPREPIIQNPEVSIENLIDKHISSPGSNEIFLPLTIDKIDKYTLTPKKIHKRRNRHVTHKLYKRTKSKSSRNRHSKSKTKSHRSSHTL